MTQRTRVAMTYEEVSPGVPFWGANTVTTDLLPDQTEIAIENLVAGRTYYIKTWNEDEFGNKSPELVRSVSTPLPTRLLPLSFSANGVLDSGSPMYAYVKVPSFMTSVKEVIVTFAFRQFFASAQDAASGGGSTSGSGGSSTPTSGASSASSSSNHGLTVSNQNSGLTLGSGNSGAASAGTAHTHTAGSYAGTLNETAIRTIDNHSHTIAHTHDVTIGNHTHTTPAHTHALTYGTFEEAMPASHSVTVKTYKRAAGVWTLVNTSAAITTDLADLDLTAVITGPGDWRIQVQSDAAQPNGGRLGCDVYGSISGVALQ
jgi:hypothetical protein